VSFFTVRKTIIAILPLSAAAGVLLVLQIRLPADIQLWREIQNAGHVPLFGILALAILSLSRQLFHPLATTREFHYLIALVGTIVIGAVTELVQIFADRDADLYDLLRDTIGAVGFLGLYLSFDRHALAMRYKWGNIGRRVVQAGSLALLAVAFVPLIMWTTAYVYRAQAFPQILSFDSYWGNRFLILQDAELAITAPPQGWPILASSDVGSLTLRPAEYPGLMIQEPFPDWTGFEFLSFAIYSEMPTLIELVLRINDQHHNDAYEDRFNYRLTVVPGFNDFLIPLDKIRTAPADREMDMRRIAALALFAVRPQKTYTIKIDGIRLK
jgi:VanZ family protein